MQGAVSAVSPSTVSAGIALLAAIAWGGGDFAGGMGVKFAGGSTLGALRVVVTAHAMSLLVLLSVLGFQHAAWPTGTPMLWGLVAGVAGGLSLTAFYVALARGAMGASAAISGLLAAALPAVVALWTEGAPSATRLLGFALAAGSIWLIAVAPTAAGDIPVAGSRVTNALAIGGGIGFGFYFVALRFANPLGIVEPMALARVGSLTTCISLLLVMRVITGRSATTTRPLPSTGAVATTTRIEETESSVRPGNWLGAQAWMWAAGVAVMDTGGNLLFVTATRTGRLDVSAVLASLYPASTILLAAAVLKETPGRRQMLGMGVAVAAVVLITV